MQETQDSSKGSRSPWFVKIQHFPKPVVYILLVAVLLVPLFKPLQLPLAFSAHTEKAYRLIDDLPEGSYVFHSVMILPATDAELWPQMLAMSRHYMMKGLKVIYWSYAQEGLMYADKIRLEAAPSYGYEYGEDYAILPYKAGQESAVASLKDFYSIFSTDAYGTALSALPLFDVFHGMEDLSLLVVNTGSDDTTYFVRHIEPEYGMPIIAAGTAPVLPNVSPYLNSGQVKGAVVGTSGAAEYEILAGVPGLATGAMDAQQIGHVLIIVMVALGNLGYLFQRKHSPKGLRGGSRGR